LPEVWADRYISQGKAELVEDKRAKEPEAETPAGKKSKKK
jgi:hypothetical protein